METLNPSFCVDKRARRLGERSDGQHHVGNVHVGLERTEADNHLGGAQTWPTVPSRRRIKARLTIEQDSSLQGTAQHLGCVQSTRTGLGAGELGANRVGSFGQVTDAGPGLFADPVCQSEQTGRPGVMRGRIAQQNSLAFAAEH